MKSITERVISDREKMNFLPKKVGSGFWAFENILYQITANLSQDYTGGMWEFVELSNGGFYCRPDDDSLFHCVNMAGESADLKNDAVGIFATTAALAELSWRFNDERILKNYDLLQQYIEEHAERQTLRRLMD